jgi:hypothetical protein
MKTDKMDPIDNSLLKIKNDDPLIYLLEDEDYVIS